MCYVILKESLLKHPQCLELPYDFSTTGPPQTEACFNHLALFFATVVKVYNIGFTMHLHYFCAIC
jgi:hypothetical protein